METRAVTFFALWFVTLLPVLGSEGRLDLRVEPFVSVAPIQRIAAWNNGYMVLDSGSRLHAFSADGKLNQGFRQAGSVAVLTDFRCDSKNRIVCKGIAPVEGDAAPFYRLSANGAIDGSFFARYEIWLRSLRDFGIAVDGRDNVILSGDWAVFGDRTGETCVRLDEDGRLDGGFTCPQDLPACTSILPLSNGEYLLFSGVAQNNQAIYRLGDDGSRKPFTPPSGYAYLWPLAAGSDGTVICTAVRRDANGNYIWRGMLRLRSDGTLDPAFTRMESLFDVWCAAVDPAGRIYVGGRWENATDDVYGGVLRLLPNGALDETWPRELRANGTLRHLALVDDGRLLVSGTFSMFDQVVLQPDWLNPENIICTLIGPGEPPGRAVNVSSRGAVGAAGESPLIVGFVVEGISPQRVLLRAVSAGLREFGITDTVNIIDAALYRGSDRMAEISHGPIHPQLLALSDAMGAFRIESSLGNAVGALVLEPGVYSMVITSKYAGGTALGEVYFVE